MDKNYLLKINLIKYFPPCLNVFIILTLFVHNIFLNFHLKYYHQYLSYILYINSSVINYKRHSIISFIIKKKKCILIKI